MVSFNLKREFIEVEGTLYQVLKVISEEKAPIIDTWKEHLRADRVFKKEGYSDSHARYFFMREVPEAEIVTDEPSQIENNENNEN